MKTRRSLVCKQLAIVLGLVLFLGLAAAPTARALEFDDDGVIPADVVVDDDVFISNDTVRVDGDVNGDLVASAFDVTINGTVGGNLIVNASKLVVNGPVGGSVFFSGRTLQLDAPVAGSVYAVGAEVIMAEEARLDYNAYFAGFSFEMNSGAQIGRDLRIVGYQVLLNGRVDRHVRADVAGFEIGGQVGGDVETSVEAPKPPPAFLSNVMPAPRPSGLRVLETARITGKLTYTSPVEQASAIRSQPAGGVVYRLPEKPAADSQPSLAASLGHWFAARLRWLVTLAAVGAGVVWLLPGVLQGTVDRLKRKPWQALGVGLMSIPVLIVLALSALLGLLLLWILLRVVTLDGLAQIVGGVGFGGWGVGTTAVWALAAFLSKLAVAYVGGEWLFRRLSPNYAGPKYWPLLVGSCVYVVLQGIPCLGNVWDVVGTVLGFGAIVLLANDWRIHRRAARQSPPQLAPAAQISPPE